MFSNWLHSESEIARIASFPVRDVYDVYTLQCIWVLLSTLYAVRSADGDHRIMSFPLASLALPPLTILPRGLRAEIGVFSGRHLFLLFRT